MKRGALLAAVLRRELVRLGLGGEARAGLRERAGRALSLAMSGSWGLSSMGSLWGSQSNAEPEPESEQLAKAPSELVVGLSLEEEAQGSQADREALLAALQGATAGLHAEVAAALRERLQHPSILIKIKAAELIALLLAKDSGFAAAARPYLEESLTEHARFGEGDPKDDSAARVREAVAESTVLLSSSGAAAEGVPPDSAESGGGSEQALSRSKSAPVDRTIPAEPEPQTTDGEGIGRGEFDSVLQTVQELEADVEQLENTQIQQASAAEAGQQQLTDRVQALDEQLRQVSAQAQGGRGAQEQAAAAEAAAALASQAAAQKQQADRLAALEAQMQTMASELSQSKAQAESERSRAVAAEERLSDLVESHERKLESHEHKLQESDKIRDEFEIATSEALANEVDDTKKACLTEVQTVADSNAMLKQTINVLTEQISLVEQALKEATSSASTQLRSSVDELSSRIDFIEVQQQAESQSDSFTGESGGADQSMVETRSDPATSAPVEVLQLKRAQTDLANLVQAQTERVSVVEQQLAQQLSDFTAHRQSEQDSRVKQNEVFEALVEMKADSLKQELLGAALEQQRASESRLDDTQRNLQGTMDEQNKQTRIRLQQLEDGLVQSKEKRRKELQEQVEQLSGEIDEKVSAERNQTVAREAKAAELADERSAAVRGEIEQLKQGQAKQSEEAAQAQAAASERLKASTLEFAAVREEMVQLVQDKLGAHNETVQSQQADREENLKAEQTKIFEALREREEAAEMLGTKTEELTRHVAEALRRADDFDESIADHAKTLVQALAESDQRVSTLQERLQTVEDAHAAAQAALESAAVKDKAEAEAEAAAAERVAQLERDVSALKDVVQSGNTAATAAAAAVQDSLSEVQTQVARASAAAESAQQTSGGHQTKLAEITDTQQTLLGKVDKQEEIVRLLATKTKGVEDLSAKKIDRIEKEVGEAVRAMGTKVDTMESQVVDFTTCAPPLTGCMPLSLLLARLACSVSRTTSRLD
eukprot:COSAG02_NODE_3797_length_6216_cov_4.330227_4_plen_1003_part_00